VGTGLSTLIALEGMFLRSFVYQPEAYLQQKGFQAREALNGKENSYHTISEEQWNQMRDGLHKSYQKYYSRYTAPEQLSAARATYFEFYLIQTRASLDATKDPETREKFLNTLWNWIPRYADILDTEIGENSRQLLADIWNTYDPNGELRKMFSLRLNP
jgi:hypothetical protein